MLRQRFLLLVLMRLLAQTTIADWPLQPLAVFAWASCLRETAPNVEASSMQTCYELRGEQRKLYRDSERDKERVEEHIFAMRVAPLAHSMTGHATEV